MTKSAADNDFESLFVGQKAEITHLITDSEIDAFAALSGDVNPLHVDAAYAKTTAHGARVVHGMFLGSLVSRLIGMQLPGKRSLLVREMLEFKKPVYIDDTVVVKGVVANKSESTRLVEIHISIERDHDVVAVGSAHVRVN